MKRRNFIKLAGIGTAIAAIPVVSLSLNNFHESLTGIIINELDYLKLDKAGVEKFVIDFAKEKPSGYRLKVRTFYMFRTRSTKSETVEQIIHSYLRSSDFFINKMDETKTVNYLGMYDPYKACRNPFSFIYYQPKA